MGRLVSLMVDGRPEWRTVGKDRVEDVMFYIGGMVLVDVGNVYCSPAHEQHRRMGRSAQDDKGIGWGSRLQCNSISAVNNQCIG